MLTIQYVWRDVVWDVDVHVTERVVSGAVGPVISRRVASFEAEGRWSDGGLKIPEALLAATVTSLAFQDELERQLDNHLNADTT